MLRNKQRNQGKSLPRYKVQCETIEGEAKCQVPEDLQDYKMKKEPVGNETISVNNNTILSSPNHDKKCGKMEDEQIHIIWMDSIPTIPKEGSWLNWSKSLTVGMSYNDITSDKALWTEETLKRLQDNKWLTDDAIVYGLN